MSSARGAGRVRALFDSDAFAEDLKRTSASGRELATRTRETYERRGCPLDQLLACDPEGADGTKLPHCVKVYLPAPDGRFGMVFHIDRRAGKLLLVYMAFGARHQPRGSNAWTVYQIADDRLRRG